MDEERDKRKSFGMAGDERAFVVCLKVLRCLGLSFTKVRRTAEGELVAVDSAVHLCVNLAVAGFFLYAFFQINPVAYSRNELVYKSSTIVYPLHTKLMILTIVAFSLCGNVYNRKFIGLLNLFLRVRKELEAEFGRLRGKRKRCQAVAGCGTLLVLGVFVVVTIGMNVWTEFHLKIHYQREFRLVHYICFCYASTFTAHFVFTMSYLREKFKELNAAFGKGRGGARRRLGTWMATFMDLREAEGLVNEVFGKQIFLTLLLAFSSIIVNAYYLIALNLYGTSNKWLNMTMCVGFSQAVTVALINARAAELAANEANKINEIIFTFPVHLHNWKMFNQVKYFTLYSHSYPVEFKVWIFYAINYNSLFKVSTIQVILTSSAITAVILQCDFLRGSFHASN